MRAPRPCGAAGLALAALAALVVVGAAAWPTPARAQIPPSCFELCGTGCVKPIAIPDRWDDVTAIPGYDGTGGKTSVNWRNNARYDAEIITNDVNGNGLYDPGDGYVDGNSNGKYDHEAYDPLATGYVADPTAGNSLSPGGDRGALITIEYNNQSAPVPGQFMPLDFPPLNKGVPLTGSGPFAQNFSGCNAGVVEPADVLLTESGAMVSTANAAMLGLIAQDPGAYWDPITESVLGSAFALSPRVMHVLAYDPRIFPRPSREFVVTSKIIPMFLVRMTGTAGAEVRLLRTQTTGATCTLGSSGAWLYACATPATRATWGSVKATYR